MAEAGQAAIVPAVDRNLIGEACALLAAITWACAMVLFKRSGERVTPLALNIFKNVIALILFGITLLVMPQGLEVVHHFPSGDIAILLLSGLLGIAFADTLFFYSLNLIGVSLISIVDCLYAPFIVVFSYFLLMEELTVIHYVGIGLIIAGVFISSRHVPPANRTRGQIVGGVLLGACAMGLMTFGIVIAKPVLDMNDFPLIPATALRLLMGTLALALIALASERRREYWSVFRPAPIWKVSVPASILGTYLALLFWMAGFKWADASIAGVLNQTSVIFAIILAAVFLKEHFTRRKLLAIVLAAIGVVIVMFNDQLGELWFSRAHGAGRM